MVFGKENSILFNKYKKFTSLLFGGIDGTVFNCKLYTQTPNEWKCTSNMTNKNMNHWNIILQITQIYLMINICMAHWVMDVVYCNMLNGIIGLYIFNSIWWSDIETL